MTKSFTSILVCAVILTIVFLSKTEAQEAANLKVGAILPLSAMGSFPGIELKNGIELCKPKNITIIFEDSQANPTTGVTAFNKLVNADDIKLAITAFSGVTKAIIPIANNRKIPLLTTVVSSSNVLKETGGNAWRYFSSGEQEAPIMAKLAAEKLRISKASIIYSENDYGISYRDAFQTAFEAHGGKVVSMQSYLNDTVDFVPLLLKAKSSGAEGIYIVGLEEQELQIVRKAKELKIKAKLMSNWILASPTLAASNENILEGVYLTTPRFYFSDRKESANFKSEYLQRYAVAPSAYAAIGCDFMHLMNGHQSINEIMESIKTLRNYPGIMEDLTSDGISEIKFELFPASYLNGKLVLQ
ncbi:MAG: penicillin-binding protein activator [Deltaproteobacteria bacterium]|nr:penicillin-binding protein activator [Deltaproteobacteria bacterium]